MSTLPPRQRTARVGLTLIDPESEGVYLTLWPVLPEYNDSMWAVLVLCPETELELLDDEQLGGVTYVRKTWIEHYAVEP